MNWDVTEELLYYIDLFIKRERLLHVYTMTTVNGLFVVSVTLKAFTIVKKALLFYLFTVQDNTLEATFKNVGFASLSQAVVHGCSECV